MKLVDVRGVEDYCKWLQSKGISPSENAYVGQVHTVHVWDPPDNISLHYKTQMASGAIVVAANRQGKLAVDINDNDLGDDLGHFDSEHDALKWVYDRTLEVLGPNGKDVLDELFFDKWGFIKESPKVNHPISGHETHAHAGFKRLKWG